MAGKIFNLGSINIDRVYFVDHITQPGETIHAKRSRLFAGGKGANQSIALARAGADVLHIGCIGSDDLWLMQHLASAGVDVSNILRTDLPTGQALIQVAADGENAIVVYGGANLAIESMQVEQALMLAGRDDVLLLQNEVNDGLAWMQAGLSRGLKVWLNPAPMEQAIADWPLHQLAGLVLNEYEACALTGESSHSDAFASLVKQYRKTMVVLTRGAEGASLGYKGKVYEASPPVVEVVDTTAAGDTFIGYLIAELLSGSKPQPALELACHAAALSVSREGAGKSIPTRDEVNQRWPELR